MNRVRKLINSFGLPHVSLIVGTMTIWMCFWLWLILPTKTGFPIADDLNFFIPLIIEIEESGEFWVNFLNPQGPHFHFSYKLMSIALMNMADYDTRVYTVLGPIALAFCSVLFLMKLDPWGSRKPTILLPIFTVLVISATMSPTHFRNLQYDMLALNGHLQMVACLFLVLCIERIVLRENNAGWKSFLFVACIVVFFFGTSEFKPYFTAVIGGTVFVLLSMTISISPKNRHELTSPWRRFLFVFFVLASLWVAYDAFIRWTGYKNNLDLPLNPKIYFTIIDQGLYQSLGGDIALNSLGIGKHENLFRAFLMLLVSLALAFVVPILVKHKQIFLLTTLLTPALFAAGAYSLRGTVEIPRYQGQLGIFWIALSASVGWIILNKKQVNWSAKSQPYRSAFTITFLSVFIFAATAQYGTGRHLVKYKGSVANYYAKTVPVFHETQPLTEADLRFLQCNNRERCEKSVQRIREQRGLGID